MKIALVQDWLTELGGAEKVFKILLKIYPEADVYTLTSHPRVTNKLQIHKNKLHESFISKLPLGRTKYRYYLPLFKKAIESFDFAEYDLIISSSSSVAKGILTSSNQVHICYCHSPVRYAWDLYHQYINEANLKKSGLKSWIIKHYLHQLRIWDIISSNRVDHYIANSQYIKKRIKKIYRRDALVIYPPVDLDRFQLCMDKDDYYFTASRLVPYKKIDLIIKAFNHLDKRLIVAGIGPDLNKIKKLASNSSNIEVLGYISDSKMVELMQHAKAFVFAADEDFGIIPVEAQACGTPVIALGKGGTNETVINDKTGVHFKSQTVQEIMNAVKLFETKSFDINAIRIHAEKFSSSRFENEIKIAILNILKNE